MSATVLLLDNYDSFTYNIVQAVATLGTRVSVVRSDQVSAPDVLAMQPQGVIISPGPGRPAHAGNCLDIVRSCTGRLPILGICLGHQVIAEAFGARVEHAREPMHGKCSIITHAGERLFDRVPTPLRATRYHSLVVNEASLRATPLRVFARADDASVMAIAHPTHPTFGLQFHPESVMSEHGQHIFANFVAMTGSEA